MTALVDAHVHLDRHGPAWAAALEELRATGTVAFAVSMDVASYRATRVLCAQEPRLLPSFGIHPWEAPAWARRLDELEPLVEEAPMLGEVGLDQRFVKDPDAYRPQEDVFAFFLEAARRTGKLLNLHTSGAEARVADLLSRYAVRNALVHWYNGPMGVLDRLVEVGAYFSVGVEVLESERIVRVARRIPLERLLTETDNPGGWQWLTGEQGMPSLLPRVVDELARVRGVEPGELAAVVEENARRLLASAGVPWPIAPHVT
ncbi:MAG: hypothetical protein AMXMBFR53_00480 [Gemmatimonadota bacterium]